MQWNPTKTLAARLGELPVSEHIEVWGVWCMPAQWGQKLLHSEISRLCISSLSCSSPLQQNGNGKYSIFLSSMSCPSKLLVTSQENNQQWMFLSPINCSHCKLFQGRRFREHTVYYSDAVAAEGLSAFISDCLIHPGKFLSLLWAIVNLPWSQDTSMNLISSIIPPFDTSARSCSQQPSLLQHWARRMAKLRAPRTRLDPNTLK